MRRNTVRLLKYLIVACGFVLFGPMTLKYIFGNKNEDGGPREDFGYHAAQGMPEDPDVVKRVRENKPTVSTF